MNKSQGGHVGAADSSAGPSKEAEVDADGSAQRMFGAEERAPCPGPDRHGSRCQHADIYTRRHLRRALSTHLCAHTHAHRRAEPINTLPPHKSFFRAVVKQRSGCAESYMQSG